MADVTVDGENAGDRLGCGGVATGDFNGDGVEDFAVGTYASNGGFGGVYVMSIVDQVTPVPPEVCISTVNPCVTVPVVLERASDGNARGLSVTVSLSPELELCDVPAASITQGPWLSGYPNHYQVIDEGGGVYIVDQAILGAPPVRDRHRRDVVLPGRDQHRRRRQRHHHRHPCGRPRLREPVLRAARHPRAGGGHPHRLHRAGAVADLAATQVKSGNDSDGTTQIDLAWTGRSWTWPRWRSIGRGSGSIPSTTTTAARPRRLRRTRDRARERVGAGRGAASGYTDEPATRDYWYYVAYVMDNCDNISGVSNRTDGTLNYHLGDICRTVSPPATGTTW